MFPGPTTEPELQEAIRDAAAGGTVLEIRGGGTKFGIGMPGAARVLDLRGLSGVVDYDPAEMVLTVRAGTPLPEVERLLADERQRLAFAPFDWAPLFGGVPGAGTIGGAVMAAVAGSRRFGGGMARDHVLGLSGVSGRGDRFVCGGRVVKNVSGFDLPKLLTGSWGRLAAVSTIILRTVPVPRLAVTWMLDGLAPRDVPAALAAVRRSRIGASALAHDPGHAGRGARTGILLEGFEPAVEARGRLLGAVLERFGRVRPADRDEAGRFWRELETASVLADAPALWRVVVPTARTGAVIDAVEPFGARWLLDWGGGLLLLGTPAGAADAVRAVAEQAGGHATLLRGDAVLRRVVPPFQPRPAAVAAIEARLRRGFDPAGVFETGRFGADAHAH